MSLRRLFAVLIAVAMLFAPLALRSGSAMAMAPAKHHSQMMGKGHCGEQPGKDGKSAGKSCCAAMCTAVALAPVSPVEPFAFPLSIERPSLAQSSHSYLAKLPTPPPRRA
ncbi:MAG: hypothetical protein ABIP07_04655 [Sphingomicrobium sp.]